MIDATLTGDGEAIARLAALREGVPRRLRARIGALAERLEALVVAKLSDDVLHVRSGRLAGSIHAEETDSGAAIVARIGVAGAAGVYAPVQEYGGVFTIRAHLATIREAWGKPLAGGARQVAVKSHLARYPEHSFTRSALAEMRGDIEDGIADAVTQAVMESDA